MAPFNYNKGLQTVNAEESPSGFASVGSCSFSPARHLNYTTPSKLYTMKELGYPESRGVSPVGVSEPFPLFSVDAVQKMRQEFLSDTVFAKYRFSSDLSQCQLRGYARE